MTFLDDFLNTGCIVSFDKESVLIGWGERSWRSKQSSSEDYSFYFPDFFLEDEKPWFTQSNTKVLSIEELIDLLEKVSTVSVPKLEWQELNRMQYTSIFNDLKSEYLYSGILQKGVPFVISKAKGRIGRSSIAHSLLSTLKSCLSSPTYFYGFWEDDQGMLGATPELLFRKNPDDHTIETVACAGTCSSDDEVSQFLSDPKELSEHNIVIQGIKHSLESMGNVWVHDSEVLHLPNLKHLYTPITFDPHSSISFKQLVDVLHPTPALGAYPKIVGTDWLKSLRENLDRKRFGAPVGFITGDGMQSSCYVAIRNMQWDRDMVSVCAGGGVVLQSELGREWNEIQLKLKTIKKMLAIETQS